MVRNFVHLKVVDHQMESGCLINFPFAFDSRGEAKGANCYCEGAPWQADQGVQPHQPGAQPAWQKTEEGKKCIFCPIEI